MSEAGIMDAQCDLDQTLDPKQGRLIDEVERRGTN
jgi:hypothetical protein